MEEATNLKWEEETINHFATVLSSNVASTSFKAPRFLEGSPEAWFTILDSAFETARITVSATKFSHAVQLLDAKHVSQITDLLKKRDYEQLKTRLIRL